MKRFLVVVDMQKDFVDGALGSSEAAAIVEKVVEKIKSFDGEIFVTLDTHYDNYSETAEGRKLPVPHCIKGTDGWKLDKSVASALENREYMTVEKPTFGSVKLPKLIEAAAGEEDFSIEIIGLCTDISVVSNALLLKAGLFLQKRGYRYITVAASQSINKNGWNYTGRYSHKKAAVLSGLGTIGKSSMFLHKDYGTRVRLGTVFTDAPFDVSDVRPVSLCKNCDLCVKACPSGAISGKEWAPGVTREEMFDAEKCSTYMKKHFQHIGRGAVCGICMEVCPHKG